MIKTIQDIQDLVLAGETDWDKYGYVNVREYGDFLIFSYSKVCAWEANWNYFERLSRGLILNKNTGEIVARPFEKFFNYGERELYPSKNSHLIKVFEKMDGSLGILYRDDDYKISTRGSMRSDQALWATEFLQLNYNLEGLPENYTLLFEIVYPENRIVVDYGKREDLILLGIIDRFTGYELPFSEVLVISKTYNFTTPKLYDFNDIEDIINWSEEINGVEDEGAILLFSDGQRFKIKGADYVKIHRLVSQVSFKNTFNAYTDGTILTLLEVLPDEFHKEIDGWISEISNCRNTIIEAVDKLYNIAPKDTKKEFAQFANQTDYSHLLFAKNNKSGKFDKVLNTMIYDKLTNKL